MAGAYPGGYAEGYGSATATLVPFLAVEFDPDVWTDVSADVVNLATRRGRNRESGAFEPGTISVTLRNDDRRYDPDHVTGPWYGKLRPSRRVRLTATWIAQYPVIMTSIDRITQQWGGPNDATAVIDATDAFKDLNRVELPSSVYVAEVDEDSPIAWWRLDEPDGSATVADSVGNVLLTPWPGADVDLGASGLVVRDPGSAMLVNVNVNGGYARQGPLLFSGPPMSIELVYQHTVGADKGLLAGEIAYDPLSPTGVDQFQVFTSGTDLLLSAIGPAGIMTFASSGVNVVDGAVHHIVVTWGTDNIGNIWVDGILRGSGSASSATSAFDWGSPTGTTSVGSTSQSNGSEGTYQHVAFYDYVLPFARIDEHNTAARTPWRGQTSGARLLNVLTLGGIPPADQNVAGGSTTLQSTDLGGTALAYAQKVEETENGWLFVARDGRITFVSRQNGITGTYLIPRNQFADADSGAVSPPNVVPYRTASADVDEATLVTRATVSREGSVAVTVGDAAAQAEFGIIDETHDGLLHDSDVYSRQYAEWILNTHKTPSSRVGAIEVTPEADPVNLWPFVLGLELADPVTFKRKPQNTGAVVTKSMRVESISHFVSGAGWVVAYQLSPFDLAGEGLPVFTWDVTRWDQHVWGF